LPRVETGHFSGHTKEKRMKYRRVLARRFGGPEVLEVVEEELTPPAKGQVRIRVEATSVSRPDVSVRSGHALWTGTFLEQKLPITPGYAVIGVVDAAGQGVDPGVAGRRVGVLTVVGGYTEALYWRADRLIPLPARVDAGEAVTLILNYIVAYQCIHRAARAQGGETALIIGASGGIGSALLQLGRLAGLKMYGVASGSKRDVVAAHGAQPIDYRTEDFAEVLRRCEPEGIDVALDGMMRLGMIRATLPLLRRGGRMVCFGEPQSRGELARILGTVLRVKLTPDGKRLSLYGTSSYSLFDQKSYLEDWGTLFRLLEAREIEPVITARYPILQAAQANARLESGEVVGNVVLVAE
jgi:NADPH:quinone reductase-like Zn-dependent oxidoreductase